MFESLNYRGLRETALLTAMMYGGSGSHCHWQQIPDDHRVSCVTRWHFRHDGRHDLCCVCVLCGYEVSTEMVVVGVPVDVVRQGSERPIVIR